LEEFVSNAPNGFVYFSLGTILQGMTVPDSVRQKILNVFSRLKQKVVWKWETEKMDDVPKNVLLKKWLPQQDLLGKQFTINSIIKH
jgi:glucuronosyltransferase